MWKTSPFAAEAAEGLLNFSSTLQLVDCTLRDGEQQAGIVFSRSDKLEIACALDRAGILEIEAGTPAVSVDDCEAVREIVAAGLQAKISAVARARRDDVDLVAATGAWGVRISLPISQIQRQAKLGLSDEEYLRLAVEITTYAKERGLACIFSPYDTTRSDIAFLRQVISELSRRGTVDRVRLVDTTGCATPHVVKHLVYQMKNSGDIPLEIHCHNDFGLATANTLAGAEAGAEYLSVTVNGIGERAGNAALEEVGVALHVLHGIDTGLNLSQLKALSQLVEERSGMPLQKHKAVVGDGAFAHESGMVVAGLQRDPFTAEPFLPALVGQQRKIVLGKKSGLQSVQMKLAALGIEADGTSAQELLAWVKQEALRTKQAVSDETFRRRAEQLVV